MCWSFEVSMAFAALEAAMILFIYRRSRKSEDPYVRAQIMCLPMLISVCLIEFVEGLIWLDETLVSIELEPGAGPRCSSYNSTLTLIIWLVLMPWQPFFFLFPCRRTGPQPENRDRFEIPEWFAILYAGNHIGTHFFLKVQEVLKHFLSESFSWSLSSLLPSSVPLKYPERLMIHRSNYCDYINSVTCSYIGQHNHLYWTFQVPWNWTTPNILPYSVICMSVFFGRPYRFAAGLFSFMGILVFAQLAYYKHSPELMSVWCYTGIICHTYFVIQPYVLPVKLDVYSQDKQTLRLEKEQLNRNNNKNRNNNNGMVKAK